MFFVVGSKNVHAALRSRDDIAAYSEARYTYAMKIASLWFNMFDALPTDARAALTAYLCREGVTLCAEACFADSQHIVDYNGQDLLTFYAISRAAPSRLGITAVPPLQALQLLQSWQLPVVEHRIVPDIHDAALRQSVREHFETAPNMEGAVVYVLDAAGCVAACTSTRTTHTSWSAPCDRSHAARLSFDITRRMSAPLPASVCAAAGAVAAAVQCVLHTELKTTTMGSAGAMGHTAKEVRHCPCRRRERILSEFDTQSTRAGQLQLLFVGLVGSGKSTLGVAAAHAWAANTSTRTPSTASSATSARGATELGRRPCAGGA